MCWMWGNLLEINTLDQSALNVLYNQCLQNVITLKQSGSTKNTEIAIRNVKNVLIEIWDFG